MTDLQAKHQFRIDLINRRLEVIKSRIDQREQSPVTEWGQVGTLGYIIELLDQVVVALPKEPRNLPDEDEKQSTIILEGLN